MALFKSAYKVVHIHDGILDKCAPKRWTFLYSFCFCEQLTEVVPKHEGEKISTKNEQYFAQWSNLPIQN